MHSVQNVGHVSTRAYFHPMLQICEGHHATHDTCPVSSWIYGHAMPHLVPFKIHIFFLKLELEKVHLLHKLLYWIYLTSHMSIVCPLLVVNHFFGLNFQKEKNNIKKGICHCKFPFFCWEKIAKFWKKKQ
jgi:hypothetical protein